MSIEINIGSPVERVTAGMAFLDEHFPGHADRVELENLAVQSGTWCPLGQAGDSESYSATVDVLEDRGINLRQYDENGVSDAHRLGFMSLGDFRDSYHLDQAWIKAYEQRKNEKINAG